MLYVAEYLKLNKMAKFERASKIVFGTFWGAV
jgi:hypothetical protein